MKKNKIWEISLLVLIVVQMIVALWLSVFTLVDFEGILEQFGTKYQVDAGITQLMMLYSMLLSFCICLWSMIWIGKGNIAGVQGGTTIGLILFIVGVTVFIKFNRTDILLFDSLRGLLMMIFGILAYNTQ